MGSYAFFHGDQTVPEEKREEFSERVQDICYFGGMMDNNYCYLYGRQIILLSPPVPDENGNMYFYYNYLGDDSWETARYNIHEAELKTNKIGSYEFCRVIMSIYILYEFYAEDYGVATLNGEFEDCSLCIGWLNYLFDERYTNKRQSDLSKVREFTDSCHVSEEQKGDCDVPVSVVNTTDFLHISENSFCFYDAVRYKWEKDYQITDDDRAYYWMEDGDVRFSDEMMEWLGRLNKEYKSILHSEFIMMDKDEFGEKLVSELYLADKLYQRMYAFQEMFDEFMEHYYEKEYQAALLLFSRLVKYYFREGSVIYERSIYWDLTDRNILFNHGRIWVKRFLAVMANKPLRDIFFDF